MNREIIFRGKRVDNGEWIYGRGLQQCKDELGNEIVAIFVDVVKSEKYIKKEGKYTLYYAPVNPETLGQYTGLKDKDGNKIFEGDILDYTLFDDFGEDHQYKGVVKWINDCFICDNSDGFNGLAWAVNQSLELEVIGNVTDNPELMK